MHIRMEILNVNLSYILYVCVCEKLLGNLSNFFRKLIKSVKSHT